MLPKALCAFALMAPLIMLPGNYDAANLPQAAFIQVGALALLVARLAVGGPAPLLRTPWSSPLVGLLAWAALSVSWATDPSRSIDALGHWAACALVAFLVPSILASPAGARRLAAAVLASGLVVAALGLAQKLLGLAWLPQAFPPAATFVNKNVAASYVVATWPLVLAMAVPQPGRLAAWGLTLAVPFSAAYLFHSLARSAWVAVAVQVALLAVGWMRGARRRGVSGRRAALAAAAVGVVLVALIAAGGRETWRAAVARVSTVRPGILAAAPPPGSSEPHGALSVRGRLAVWRNTLALLRERPVLGAGLANLPVEYPRFARAAAVDPLFSARTQLDFAHNDALQLAAELGLVGFGLALWLCAALARAARVAWSEGDAERRAVLAAVALSACGIAVDALFSFPLQRALPPLLLAFHAGTLGVLWREGSATAPGAARARPGWMRPAALVAAAALCLAAGVLRTREILADRHVWRALGAERAGNWPRAFDEAGRALALDPGRREALFLRGSAALALRRGLDALGPLQALERRLPHDIATLGNLSEAYAATGDGRRAAEVAGRLAELDPGDAQAHYRLGILLERDKRPAEALSAYRRATELRPDDARLHFGLGVAALRAHATDEARAALERALALDPSLAAAHKALGVLLYEVLGLRAEGAAHLEQALALQPAMPDAQRMRRLVEESRSETPRAGTPRR